MRIATTEIRCTVFVVALLSSGGTLAESALVERADPATGLSAYQFLDAGTRIHLSDGLELELGYFRSCVREQIRGGTVTIGENQSRIDNSGRVDRITLDCTAEVRLNAGERQESGASAWRAPVGGPPQLLDNLTPVFAFGTAPGEVVIQRTDRPADPIRLDATGLSVDLATLGIELAEGAIYDVSAGNTTRRIEVDFGVTQTGGPAFKRLVRF